MGLKLAAVVLVLPVRALLTLQYVLLYVLFCHVLHVLS